MSDLRRLNDILESLSCHPTARLVEIGPAGRIELDFLTIRRRVSAAVQKLSQSDCGPGLRVGIWAPSSMEWLVVDLAYLALGAAVFRF